MKIHKQEINDGVDKMVREQASLAYCSQATVSTSKEECPESLEKILAQKSNPDQIDLYYLESVLVSTGWNKNDDVFITSEVWEARGTPEDKQFNFMHDENDIIGHITGSYVLGKDGQRVEAESQDPPKNFDIITEAVLYNGWTDPENKDRMQQIIAEIEEGKWYVSMECLFAGFDYALVDADGKNQVLKRDESSAFLTKHLKAYGGSGEYEGYTVGRALRNISFSGKGLVSKPANPRSVILSKSKAFNVNEDDIITTISIGDVQMSDNLNLLEQQVSSLKEDLVTAKEENKALKLATEEAKDNEFASTVESFEADVTSKDEAIAELEEAIKSTQARIAELEDALAQSQEELVKSQSEIEEMHQKEVASRRKAALVEAGFEDEEAEESLVLYSALSDEAFDAIVSQWWDKKKKDKDKKEDKEDKDKPKASETSEELEEADETEAAEAVEELEEAFEEVESTEAALVEPEVDELQSTRASISEWLSSNVLNK
jgi:hypothetical protein